MLAHTSGDDVHIQVAFLVASFLPIIRICEVPGGQESSANKRISKNKVAHPHSPSEGPASVKHCKYTN